MILIDMIVAIGRLAYHLKGAWKCTCEIAVIVDTHLGTDDLVTQVVEDPGF